MSFDHTGTKLTQEALNWKGKRVSYIVRASRNGSGEIRGRPLSRSDGSSSQPQTVLRANNVSCPSIRGAPTQRIQTVLTLTFALNLNGNRLSAPGHPTGFLQSR